MPHSTPQSGDRRVARTRATLQHALNALILKKDYEAITVQDICDEANVGRSTFYAHFTGKDDLKRRSLDEHLRALLADRPTAAGSDDATARHLGFSLAMFEHARDHADLYRALVGGRGGTISLATIRGALAARIRAELAAGGGTHVADSPPRELVVQYLVGAFMAVLTWWLDSGAKLPAEKVDAMFRDLALNGAPMFVPTMVVR